MKTFLSPEFVPKLNGLEVEEEDESDSYQDELDDKVYKGEKERGEVKMTSSPPGATCPQRT